MAGGVVVVRHRLGQISDHRKIRHYSVELVFSPEEGRSRYAIEPTRRRPKQLHKRAKRIEFGGDLRPPSKPAGQADLGRMEIPATDMAIVP